MQWQGEKKINFAAVILISVHAYGKLSLPILWIYEHMSLWVCIYRKKEEKGKGIDTN